MGSQLKPIIPDREPDLIIEIDDLPPSKNKVDRLKVGLGITGYEHWFTKVAQLNMIRRWNKRRIAGPVLVEVEFHYRKLVNLCDTLNLLSYPPLMDALTPARGIKKVKPGIGVIDDDNPRVCTVWACEPVVDGTLRTVIRIWKRDSAPTLGMSRQMSRKNGSKIK